MLISQEKHAVIEGQTCSNNSKTYGIETRIYGPKCITYCRLHSSFFSIQAQQINQNMFWVHRLTKIISRGRFKRETKEHS